jgi:subtilisin family serine protease
MPSPVTRLVPLALAAVTACALLVGDVGAAIDSPATTTEVVVTLKAPPLAAFGRSLQSASHHGYRIQLRAAQDELADRITGAVPGSQVRWRYTHVVDGFAVVVPRSKIAALSSMPGVEHVWPNVRYHALRDTGGPQQIGADKLWGPNRETAGTGMKIGIIDDGLQADHPYFNPAGYTYPPGFPKGQTSLTTPKVIVQRTFSPASSTYRYANVPFDPTQSFHATHVAGIAAGEPTVVGGQSISGVAPNAYLGNYKALTIPTPDVGLDGNSAEIAAAIDAAVGDGMNVINLSIGEPEVEPKRDLVVAAIDGAAAAGVVPVVAAGNDFGTFGYGSISSPGNAPGAITVGAVNSRGVIADFSSAGPTPVSLVLKPDVAAPGVGVLSSLPASQGSFGLLSGTSMATPHVAGAAALLVERHPTWTVPQIKSALTQTGDPARTTANAEALSVREGGGIVDLPRADAPLLFATPSSLSFGSLAPGATRTLAVSLTDAGGGAGDWSTTVQVQSGGGQVSGPAAAIVPGALQLTATAGKTAGDVSGFVVLTRGADVRRIPFWFVIAAPALSGPRRTLTTPGTVSGTTARAASRISSYRYPTGGDATYPGPERAYRIRITGHPANFGAVTLSGRVVPHVVVDGGGNLLTGYAGLPTDLNPYRNLFGRDVPVAGAVLPAAGLYDVVFDTRSVAAAGPFTFRWWVNDVTPPKLRITSKAGGITVAATDTGSGVDPSSLLATLDGATVTPRFSHGAFRIRAAKGSHKLVLQVGDYQESKNMEDVPPILPNTATLRATVNVR